MIKPASALVALLTLLVTPMSYAEESRTVLQCGKLLNVESRKVEIDQMIVIENGTISAIGKGVDVPDGAEVVDLSEETCLPGLLDMHVHLFIDATRKTTDLGATTQSSAYNALMGLRNAQSLLRSGFTTIRITGDKDYHYATIEVRNAINRGEYTGPRMLVAPHSISPLGGHGDTNSYAPDLPSKITGPMIANGEDELRRAVRQEIKYGADWIKVMATGGVMSQHDDPTVAAYSSAELRALADETHRHRKKITAHAHADAGIRAAVEAGFDSIEHGSLMEEDTAKLMAEKGTFYVPTVYVLDWILQAGRQGGISANNLEKAHLVELRHSKSVAMARRHGVKIVLGSDPIFPMEQSIREFAALAKRIPDSWYVIEAGTINGAEMLGLEDQIGSLAVGKTADVIAVRENPIEDMRNIEDVRFVMKAGLVVRLDDR